MFYLQRVGSSLYIENLLELSFLGANWNHHEDINCHREAQLSRCLNQTSIGYSLKQTENLVYWAHTTQLVHMCYIPKAEALLEMKDGCTNDSFNSCYKSRLLQTLPKVGPKTLNGS